jgi:hypothetical protein
MHEIYLGMTSAKIAEWMIVLVACSHQNSSDEVRDELVGVFHELTMNFLKGPAEGTQR